MSEIRGRFLQSVQKRWFLVVLAALLFGGSYAHAQLKPVADAIPRSFVVASVMFVMAASLEVAQIEAAWRNPRAAFLATTVNLVFLPLAAWIVSRPLPSDLAAGILVAACVPCTLASAALWTRRAGGNDAIALFVTLVTNLACCVTMPFSLWLLTGASGGQLSFVQMALKLAELVAVPILAAQAMRRLAGVAAWVKRWKGPLGVYSQVGILSIVLTGAVSCGERLEGLTAAGTQLVGFTAICVVLVAALHWAAWLVGARLALHWRLERPDAIAVAFAGSQKTLMVGLAIAVEWGGLAVLPMMAFHTVQLLIDTILADRLRDGGLLPGQRAQGG
ncbi:MAG: bile acid:sodium symporter [Planctomycetales bacterium]|nr:bile acid:sodium symporter [Planctomycetales bacterium]